MKQWYAVYVFLCSYVPTSPSVIMVITDVLTPKGGRPTATISLTRLDWDFLVKQISCRVTTNKNIRRVVCSSATIQFLWYRCVRLLAACITLYLAHIANSFRKSKDHIYGGKYNHKLLTSIWKLFEGRKWNKPKYLSTDIYIYISMNNLCVHDKERLLSTI